MECTDSNVSIDKTSKNKVSAVGANSLYIRKPCTIFFYEKVVKWCLSTNKSISDIEKALICTSEICKIPSFFIWYILLLKYYFFCIHNFLFPYASLHHCKRAVICSLYRLR